MNHLFRFFIRSVLLITPLVGLDSAFAISSSQPTTELQGFLVTNDKEGREVFKAITGQGYSAASDDRLLEAAPGSILQYHVTFSNPTNKSLSGVNIQAVIPEGTRYVEKSATSKTASKQEYSIDGGRSWDQAPIKRTRKNKDGKTVLAVVPPSEYTNLRWLPGTIKSETVHVFKYRVQVN